ncbi:MAG: proline dehydrogenase [Candidatus Marinimicrobia bacterium]|nr:proline dehydrogenase [Candidatus Neomarinimicrobiota bacterium]|tara:strand:+ start:5061 stop:5960 length:900 start_codon:yes stop_codon:yes gene_type:complete
MGFLKSSLITLLSLLPKRAVKPFAMRYVAGESEDDALGVVHELNQLGFTATLDILGEHSESEEAAMEITESYMRLYEIIADSSLDCNISTKLTHLGLGFNDTLAEKNLFRLLDTAEIRENFLRIDMENSPYTDATLDLYEKCKAQYPSVGPVLQAYLKRSGEDLKRILSGTPNVRICKGIYREPDSIALQDRQEIRNSFIDLVQTGLSNGAYIGIATHDTYLIDTLETWIDNQSISKDCYEFQVLYGVPIGNRLEYLLDRGHKVRIYIPFGDEWYAYAMRRFKENPKIISYIMGNWFKS